MFERSLFWLLFVNTGAWAFFHLSISFLFMKVPEAYYEKESAWYKPFRWERNGVIWQDVFHVRAWKGHLPDASSFIDSAYDKRQISEVNAETLNKFIIETKRAEQSHWVQMLPAPLFFLWNPVWAGWLMIAYAFFMNIPFIIVQRYNRPRLERIYTRKQKQTP